MEAAKSERLDQAAILRHLPGKCREKSLSASIEVFPELASTNAYLLQRAAEGHAGNGAACLAEQQTAGRGRRGRSWVSPAGCGIYLSLYWEFDLPAHALSGLSLVAAVVAAEALQTAGVAVVQLKWPNDLVVNDQKMGGILVELAQKSKNMQGVVVGLGVNQCEPESVAESTEWAALEQPWTGWDAWQDPAQPISRNILAAQFIGGLREACADFALNGFAAWRSRWEGFHRDQSKSVRVDLEHGTIEGVAMGLDPLGGLRVATDG
ncbi:MAG: biotin--[acetyl-CoA-carboxylase] ligase, partial [Arenicellales bacterium]